MRPEYTYDPNGNICGVRIGNVHLYRRDTSNWGIGYETWTLDVDGVTFELDPGTSTGVDTWLSVNPMDEDAS